MTRGIRVAALAASAIVACAAPMQPQPATTPPPPPPGGAPPPIPGTPPEAGTDTRIFRFELDVEPVASPTGEMGDRHNSAMAYRFAYFGANPTPNFALGLSARIVDTKTTVGNPALYFIDMMGFYLRVEIPVAPQLKGYLEFEPSMIGMHVRCSNPSDFSCNDEGFEFTLRGGATGRAGAFYSIVPSYLDIGGYAAIEKTLPDEGGWFSIGLAFIAHAGPTHAEARRRQEWMRQQNAKK
jgi:hypothetical protein